MGTTSSKNNENVIKTKVLAVGRLSMVRRRTIERRSKEMEDLKKKRGEAISVFEDSSEGDISREDITSLPLKNGGNLTDGERNEAYSETSSAWGDLRQTKSLDSDDTPRPGLCLSDFKRVTRKKTIDEFELPFNIPYETKERWQDNSQQCHVCEVYTGHETYPCRICGKAFHKSCLQKLNKCQNIMDVALLHSAKTPKGWTCYICDDISNSLTEEELTRLMDLFKMYDVDKDSSITKEEFMSIAETEHMRLQRTEISDAERKEAEFRFQFIDIDSNNQLSWREFLNYQSIIVLQERRKANLVPLLTPREVELARRVFQLYDKNFDGLISKAEAAAALETWYSLFYIKDGFNNGYSLLAETTDVLRERAKPVKPEPETDNNQISSETNNCSDDEEEEEEKQRQKNIRKVTWEDHLKNMSLHIIAVRPNRNQLPVGTKDFLQRVIVTTPAETIIKEEQGATTLDLLETKSDSSGISSASMEHLL